jgi:tripartite-type tricarboxylate transporter receptor subunit TctC
MKDFDEGGQHGIIAPAGVAKDILARLHGAIVTAMRDPEVTKRLAAEGSVAVASTPEEYRALILRETAKWKKVVQAAGIQPL